MRVEGSPMLLSLPDWSCWCGRRDHAYFARAKRASAEPWSGRSRSSKAVASLAPTETTGSPPKLQCGASSHREGRAEDFIVGLSETHPACTLSSWSRTLGTHCAATFERLPGAG